MKDSITWKIGGEAGFGIITAGTMLSRAFTRAGYYILATNEYPSLIRGGHNIITVRVATKPFESMNKDVHVLVALNKETVELHKSELGDNSIVVFDPHDAQWQPTDFPTKVQLVSVPFNGIVLSLAGDRVMRNTVALGATLALLGADFTLLETIIRDQFKKKGPEVIEHNVKIARAGYDHIQKTSGSIKDMYLAPATKSEPLMVINGSEALGVGAVRAGLKLAAIYPMTPINSLITFLADHAKSLGLVYKQPEDEIAGITMAIGAAISGVRSMVATSGGGFALQVEGLSLAGMIEAPLVIDMGMRVGPATGMPTWTEQGELQFVIHAGHGEFARIVLAPADAKEAYSMAIDAFNLADRFQIPVFVLTDKYLNESLWCMPVSHCKGDVVIDRGKLLSQQQLDKITDFKRFDLTAADGVSARSIPGMKNGFYYSNSYEHDEFGHYTEQPEKRQAMVDKRLAKAAAIEKIVVPPTVYGDTQADITFVTWGTTKGPLLEALTNNKFTIKGKKANLVHFGWMYPFPTEATKKLLGSAKRIIDVEQNATAQLVSLIREHTGILIEEKILKYNGRPMYPEEIIKYVA